MAVATKEVASSDTVTIACKHPNGIRLDVFDITGKDARDGSNITDRVKGPVVRGTSYSRDPKDVAIHGVPMLIGGYALTEGVSAQLWERWLKENAGSALIEEGILFAMPSMGGAQDRAREQSAVKGIAEPLNADDIKRAGVEPLVEKD